MQAEPGRLVDQVEVPFPFPRKASLRGEAGFARLVEDTSGRLRETVA